MQECIILMVITLMQSLLRNCGGRFARRRGAYYCFGKLALKQSDSFLKSIDNVFHFFVGSIEREHTSRFRQEVVGIYPAM